MATYSSSFAWEILQTEEPGGYSPKGRKESDTTEHTLDFYTISLHLGLPAGLGAL